MDKLTRPTLRNLTAGYEEYAYRQGLSRSLRRLERERLVVQSRVGRDLVYTITTAGRQRQPQCDPERCWAQPWDGVWRVLTFDLPETRRSDRKRLWQALRAHQLGLLQRSVWVWPHEFEPVLAHVMQVENLPECFCGFRAQSLFLCSDAEVVAAAWDWEQIHQRYRTYRERSTATIAELRATPDLARLGQVARREREAYAYAFSFDPLLPRALWPKGYGGPVVENQHREFRRHLRQRLTQLAAT